METLGQKQRRFSIYIAHLILKAEQLGYGVALEESKRSDEQAEINSLGEAGRARLASLIKPVFPDLAVKILNNGKANGIRLSVHQMKLAQDLTLFRDDVPLAKSEDYQVLGEWWEKLAPDCRWGGRFQDGNHFSIEHMGVK